MGFWKKVAAKQRARQERKAAHRAAVQEHREERRDYRGPRPADQETPAGHKVYGGLPFGLRKRPARPGARRVYGGRAWGSASWLNTVERDAYRTPGFNPGPWR